MTCEVREKKFKAGNREIKLAVTAFRTGTGKVVMVASTFHRRLTMDFVTTTETYGELWKRDRESLKKLCSRFEGEEKKQTHEEYFDLFQSMPLTLVTAFQGHREWHIARRLSLTSTTTYAAIKALLRHSVDIKYNYIRTFLRVHVQQIRLQ